MAVFDLPLADELAQLAAQMSPMSPADEHLHEAVGMLTSLALDSISGATGAGVTLVDSRGRRTTMAATADLVRQADDLQYELGEGQALHARDTVQVAKGVLMQRDGLSEDAFPGARGPGSGRQPGAARGGRGDHRNARQAAGPVEHRALG